jgi:hypothetical protein
VIWVGSQYGLILRMPPLSVPHNRPAILHRFCNVLGFYGQAVGQVGNGSGDFQDTVRAATTPSEMLGNLRDVSLGVVIQSSLMIQRGATQRLIGTTLTRHGQISGAMASGFKDGRAVADGCVDQMRGVLTGDFNVQINAV